MENNTQVAAGDEQSLQLAGGRAYRRYQHLTKQLLYDLYMTQGMSTVRMAAHLGVSRNTVWEYMEMHGIPRRAAGQAGGDAVRQHHARADMFASPVTDPDVAYIVGLVMGDGHIHDRGGARRMGISLAASDRQILEDVAAFLGDATLLREQDAISETEQAKVIVAWGCSQACDDLIKLGVPLGAKSGVEPFIRFDDPALTWAFIRGASDADGHIRVYKRSGVIKGKMYGPYQRAKWSITIGRPFVEGLHQFLTEQGIPLAPAAIQPKQGTCLLEMSDQSAIIMLRDRMYAYGSLQLRRKAEIFATL